MFGVRRLLTTAIILGLTVAVAACGSSKSPASSHASSGSNPSASSGAATQSSAGSGSSTGSKSSSRSKSGSSSGGASVSATAGVPAARVRARVSLASCMRSHGINLPNPSSAGGLAADSQALQNYSQSRIHAVMQDCHAYVAKAFPLLSLSPAQRAQFLGRMVRFAQCLRSHGLNLPDPTGGSNGLFAFKQAFRQLNPHSSSFRSAMSACQSLRPHL